MAWLQTHATAVWWLTGLSTVAFVGTLIVVPWLVVRIPADYFCRPSRGAASWKHHHPVVRALLLAVKNCVGVGLFAVGVIMLFVPGQGLLTMLAGLMLLDFPGKYRCERWLIGWPPILRAVNWMRRRHGCAEIQMDSDP